MTEHHHFPTAESMRDGLRHEVGNLVVIYRCNCGAKITTSQDGGRFIPAQDHTTRT